MKTFLTLMCSVAIACSAGAAQHENKAKKPAPKPRQVQPAQRVGPARGQPRPVYQQKIKSQQHTSVQPYHYGGNAKKINTGQQHVPRNVQQQKLNRSQPIAASKVRVNDAYSAKVKQQKITANSTRVLRANKTYKVQHFNLATKTRPTKFAAVKFQQNRRIAGSQYWQGKNYVVFRNYRPVWHDRWWWHHHYNRIVFVFGGWYYWNAGWWYPAWGYDPGAYYVWDGPIYAYNGLPPDQVVANVQAALQAEGYYQGEVDGLLGPLTRSALAAYQRDHGLYMTSAIDRPTLESLGMV